MNYYDGAFIETEEYKKLEFESVEGNNENNLGELEILYNLNNLILYNEECYFLKEKNN